MGKQSCMAGVWVYIRSRPRLWTVGFYAPDGTWHTDSDHATAEVAAARVVWLNGSGKREPRDHGTGVCTGCGCFGPCGPECACEYCAPAKQPTA